MDWFLENLAAPIAATVVAAAIIGANYRRVSRWIKARDLPPAEGSHFTILVADLAGDNNGRQTRHVVRALQKQEGFRARQYGRALACDDHGDVAANIAKAEEEGRRWLRDQNADLLVWGEVVSENKVLELRFLASGGQSQASGTSYPLQERTLELPQDFEKNFGDVLVAIGMAALAPATEQAGRFLVTLLEPAVGKVKRVLDNPPAFLGADRLAQMKGAYGNAAAVLGEQSGEADWLEEAVTAYRAALEVRTRERVPLDWAMTNNNLGAALQTLGEREEGTARLEEAVSAFRAALPVLEGGGASHFAKVARRNLERAEAILKDRKKKE